MNTNDRKQGVFFLSRPCAFKVRFRGFTGFMFVLFNHLARKMDGNNRFKNPAVHTNRHSHKTKKNGSKNESAHRLWTDERR